MMVCELSMNFQTASISRANVRASSSSAAWVCSRWEWMSNRANAKHDTAKATVKAAR